MVSPLHWTLNVIMIFLGFINNYAYANRSYLVVSCTVDCFKLVGMKGTPWFSLCRARFGINSLRWLVLTEPKRSMSVILSCSLVHINLYD